MTRGHAPLMALAALLLMTPVTPARAAGQHAAAPSKTAGEPSIQAMSPSFLFLAAEDALLHGRTELGVRFLQVVAAKDPSAPLPRIKLAELMMDAGRSAEAQTWLDSLQLPSLPDDLRDRADMLRVRIFLNERKRDDAIRALSELVQRRPAADNARMMLIQLLAEAGRRREAHRLAREAAKTGDAARWIQAEIELYTREGRFSKARRLLEKLRRMRPDDPRPVLMLAQLLTRRGHADRAERVLRDFLAAHPGHLRVGNALGRLLVQQNRAREAIVIYENIAAATGNNPEVLIALGLLYYQQKDYARATERFRSALASEPSDRARYYLASSLEAQNKPEEAEKLYAAIPPKAGDLYAKAQLRLAIIETTGNRLESAARRLRKLLKQHPTNPAAWTLLSGVWLEQKRYALLLKETEPALALPKVPPRLLFNRAAALEGLKRYDEAARTIRKVIDRHPDDPEALNFLGYLYAEQGVHLKQAHRLIRKALKLKPGNGWYLDSLAWVLYRQGRYREAARIQKQAVSKVKDDPIMREHLGDILWRLGDHDGARKAWRLAIKLGHDHPAQLRRKIESGL